MKKIKRLSILSLALMAASAITAAVMPAKSADENHVNSANNGALVANSGGNGAAGVVSCVAVSGAKDCHVTDSYTAIESEAFGFRTVGNTSISTPGDGIDTTSIDS